MGVPGRPALALVALLAAATPAEATWSIVAVDPTTREVGVAGASCILGSEVIAVVVPGHGAAVAQAMTNPDARVRLRASLASGRSAAEALHAVTTRWFDSFLGAPTGNLRQYGVVTLDDPAAPVHFTGRWTPGARRAEAARGVTVQGNSLVGPEVVEQALARFQADGRSCTPRLADRLMAALVAGAEAGGDKRCAPALAALSAFLYVAAPGDDPQQPGLSLLRNRPGQPPWTLLQEVRNALRPAPGSRDENPVLLLRSDYERWARSSGPGPACLPQATSMRGGPG